jgi:hypothetical protein
MKLAMGAVLAAAAFAVEPAVSAVNKLNSYVVSVDCF